MGLLETVCNLVGRWGKRKADNQLNDSSSKKVIIYKILTVVLILSESI